MDVILPLRRGATIVERRVAGERTVVIVCDVWDSHECAAVRAGLPAFAQRVDQELVRIRGFGASVIHSPSDTMAFYKDASQRLRAASLDPVQSSLATEDPTPPPARARCRCTPPCSEAVGPPWPWSRQHEAIHIEPDDWISDDGDEIASIVDEVGAELVIFTGVHTNVCVLDRPFGIRALCRRSIQVALMRDLAEAFPADLTEETVAYIERWYCPSVESSQITAAR